MKFFYQSCYLSISRKRAMVLKLALGVILVLFYSVPSASAQEPMQDVVYLKNGSIIRGQIIELVPNISIKIQTSDGSIFVYEMEEVLKIVKEPFPRIPEKAVKEEKSPATAFVLSFILPGVGQHYNGQHVKGAIQNVLYVGGIVLWITSTWKTVDEWNTWAYWEEGYWEGGEYIEGHYVTETYYDPYLVLSEWFWIGLIVSGTTAIWSMIDAPISANKINKEIRQQKLTFAVTPKKQGMEAKLTLHF